MRDKRGDVVWEVSKVLAEGGGLEWQRQNLKLLFVGSYQMIMGRSF